MALKKKREAKAEKDGLRKGDPAGEKAASPKVKLNKAKSVKAPKKAKAVGASQSPKPAKASKKPAGRVVRKSKVTADSGSPDEIRVSAAGPNDAGGMVGQELDPFAIAKQKMKGSVPAIVDAMVELAKQGSCSHAKTLLEMTGANHMFDGEADAQGRGEPWAKLVLERLDEAELKAEQETIREQEESLTVMAE